MAPTLPVLLCLSEIGGAGGAVVWRDPPASLLPQGTPGPRRLPGRRGDILYMAFPGGSDGKESACNVGRPRFNPWIGTISWRREQQPTAVNLPGEFHGQRSQIGRAHV